MLKKIILKKIIVLSTSLLISLPAWADIDLSTLLNKVTLQFQAAQWVTTKTALVNVSVNAAVTDQGVGTVQANVLNKLKQLSDKDEWHVLSFNRSLDQSGLENIHIMAQARLPQTDLSGLRDKAKSISKPGETYTIDDVAFVPSDAEVRQANTLLRNDIYQQVSAEIATLNKQYPDQKYYVYNIDFTNAQPMMPMPMNTMAMAKIAATAAPIAVGNKAQQFATVIIASFPDAVLQKIGK